MDLSSLTFLSVVPAGAGAAVERHLIIRTGAVQGFGLLVHHRQSLGLRAGVEAAVQPDARLGSGVRSVVRHPVNHVHATESGEENAGVLTGPRCQAEGRGLPEARSSHVL